MMHKRLFAAVLLLPLCVLAQTTKPSKAAPAAASEASAGLPSEATVETFMKRMFSYQPDAQFKVMSIRPSPVPQVAEVVVAVKTPEGQQSTKFYVLPGENFAIAGDMMPFGTDPFSATRAQLAKAQGPARGPATSEVTIVEFSDLQCPSCKAAQPTIDQLLAEVPNAHFVFQNFPLEQLHPWAFKAATYADCVGRESNEAFWKFVHTVYENQEKVTAENADAMLKQFAQESGAKPDQAATCATQPATAQRVRDSIALGKAVDVNGTPTVFVNGRKIQNVNGIPYDLLKAIVTSTK